MKKKFKECDYDQDEQLTSDELLACLENHGIAKFNDIVDGVEEHLMRYGFLSSGLRQPFDLSSRTDCA